MSAFLVFLGLIALCVVLWLLPRKIDVTRRFRRR